MTRGGALLLDQLEAGRNLDAVFVRNDSRDKLLNALSERGFGGRVDGGIVPAQGQAQLHRRRRLSVEADLTDVVNVIVEFL